MPSHPDRVRRNYVEPEPQPVRVINPSIAPCKSCGCPALGYHTPKCPRATA